MAGSNPYWTVTFRPLRGVRMVDSVSSPLKDTRNRGCVCYGPSHDTDLTRVGKKLSLQTFVSIPPSRGQ